MDPSCKVVSDPDNGPRMQKKIPLIYRNGDEHHHHFSIENSEFDPSKHWLSAKVYLRGRDKSKTYWAAPKPQAETA